MLEQFSKFLVLSQLSIFPRTGFGNIIYSPEVVPALLSQYFVYSKGNTQVTQNIYTEKKEEKHKTNLQRNTISRLLPHMQISKRFYYGPIYTYTCLYSAYALSKLDICVCIQKSRFPTRNKIKYKQNEFRLSCSPGRRRIDDVLFCSSVGPIPIIYSQAGLLQEIRIE